jgi:hypothetical protein
MVVSEREKSALVVLVPEVEPLVGEFRREFDTSAIHGLGAHVTILFPFRAPDSLSAAVMAGLRAVFAGQPRFTFSLTSVGGFPSVVYLVPEPRDPFNSLMRAAAARLRVPAVGRSLNGSDSAESVNTSASSADAHSPISLRRQTGWVQARRTFGQNQGVPRYNRPTRSRIRLVAVGPLFEMPEWKVLCCREERCS